MKCKWEIGDKFVIVQCNSGDKLGEVVEYYTTTRVKGVDCICLTSTSRDWSYGAFHPETLEYVFNKTNKTRVAPLSPALKILFGVNNDNR